MRQLPAWPAAVCDVFCVLVFTVVGAASHASGTSVMHLLAVAGPFLVGLAVGWLATRAWRAPAQPWPTGVAIWFATVMLGLMLRPLFTGGFAWGFTLVTAVFLALTMIGWRLLVTVAQKRAAS